MKALYMGPTAGRKALGRPVTTRSSDLLLGDKKPMSDVSTESAVRDSVMNRDPADVRWRHLETLYEIDSSLMFKCWDNMVQTARSEFREGILAAEAVETSRSSPMDRARFLALRAEMADAWKPRNGTEWALLDMMAISYFQLLFWTDRLIFQSTFEADTNYPEQQENAKWKLPRVSEVKAAEVCEAMIDRFNRMFLRTMRQLRDLRRYMPTIVVQHANLVNVAEQQLNVASAKNGRFNH